MGHSGYISELHSFVVFISAAVAHGIVLTKRIFCFIDIIHNHIFLKFGLISFTNKGNGFIFYCTVITSSKCHYDQYINFKL